MLPSIHVPREDVPEVVKSYIEDGKTTISLTKDESDTWAITTD
jgi:hypothetical protein